MHYEVTLFLGYVRYILVIHKYHTLILCTLYTGNHLPIIDELQQPEYTNNPVTCHLW
jgi:hypothetical protein